MATEARKPPSVQAVVCGAGILSISSGVAACLLGLAAWGIAHQRTGTEGLAVIFVVFIQWVIVLVGGWILGGVAAAHGGRAGRIGLCLNVGAAVVTVLVLLSYYCAR